MRVTGVAAGARGALTALVTVSLALVAVPARGGQGPGAGAPLRIAVMDPLADRLACACVAGYAQRRYETLAAFLGREIGRPVELGYFEALPAPKDAPFDLVVGKFSVVTADARRVGLRVRTLAMLTGKDGEISQTGLFVVRHSDAAQSIENLAGRRIAFGPPEHDEKYAAPLAALEAFDLPRPTKIETRPGCNVAALAVVEKEADAAAVSSYAMPLLEGCGTLAKGELRIIGKTDPVPFIGVFATDRVDAAAEASVAKALAAVRKEPELLKAMESQEGFLPLPPLGQGEEWADWRGAGRHAVSNRVPATLPKRKHLLWSHIMTGPGMSGLAVADGCVIAADKDRDDKTDIFRCLDADSGRELWKLAYPAAGDMDFSNSPRANPVIRDGLVYLLGAFGDLHCVQIKTGEIVWRRHLRRDFGGDLPTWGWSSTPLLVGERLIVNPGAADASVAALDCRTGKTLWSTPGDPPGYASFIVATLGGAPQLIGYDVATLGGWDPSTGRRLWKLLPEIEGDFNVATPIVHDGKLLVSTENNGTRLYAFGNGGRIKPKLVASNDDLAPDTSTPVLIDGLVFGGSGSLLCLDAANGMKTCWESDAEDFANYCTFIAGNGRVLVVTQSGALCLLQASKEGLKMVSRLALFDDVPDTERDVWSHPALVGNRLYIRNLLGVYCFLLEG